jgi:hypothetical protein
VPTADQCAVADRRSHEDFHFQDRRRNGRRTPCSRAADFRRGAAGLILFLYIGIALPAVWSTKPARRRAATAVLRLILDVFTQSRQH